MDPEPTSPFGSGDVRPGGLSSGEPFEFARYCPLEIIEDYLAATLPNAWTRRELARPQTQKGPGHL